MSYEKSEAKAYAENKDKTPALDIPVIKYFWQAHSLNRDNVDNIPKFFREMRMLKSFTDNELRVLTKYFHLRNFQPDEVVFSQNESGFGFYIIFSGHIDILVKKDFNDELKSSDDTPLIEGIPSIPVARLERYDYFGELALLQDSSIRTATAICSDQVVLLGMFKPDLDQLLNYHPHIGAKFLKALSVILANRITNITSEVKSLKIRLSNFEKNV